MQIDLDVVKAELGIEATYAQPEFSLFEGPKLIETLYKRLEKYGLKISELQAENSAIIGERHIRFYLFSYLMNVKIRYDKVEVTCTELPRNRVDDYSEAIVDILGAVTDCCSGVSFKVFSVATALHAKLEGKPSRDFIGGLTVKGPEGLGPLTGAGAVFYFGPENERLLSSITVDVSAAVTDAIYLRIYGIWDGKRVRVDSLRRMAKDFVAQALASLNVRFKQI
ncbi:MAG: hypothetical protein H8K06_08670 [Nitrospira sp.]|uniref:Uncharacterized protein n=1 Tax=Nitrospira defluvii TaxID=330214 RepID=A0ABM8QL74_9BACT|nr:hypothetical protein [Nitrospira defluvii]MCS6327142.1 hypothetical protein [Nitrospira sp.]CAE6703405.1 hypothetical protein NSPZN2_10849 [Nitrospira defluvii]